MTEKDLKKVANQELAHLVLGNDCIRINDEIIVDWSVMDNTGKIYLGSRNYTFIVENIEEGKITICLVKKEEPLPFKVGDKVRLKNGASEFYPFVTSDEIYEINGFLNESGIMYAVLKVRIGLGMIRNIRQGLPIERNINVRLEHLEKVDEQIPEEEAKESQ